MLGSDSSFAWWCGALDPAQLFQLVAGALIDGCLTSKVRARLCTLCKFMFVVHAFNARRFREAFVKHCHPRFLPPSWDVDHFATREYGDFSIYTPADK